MSSRMAIKAIAAAAAVGAIALPAAASATTTTSSTESYGPGGDFVTYCADHLMGFGGGCFALNPATVSVQASLKDDVSQGTGGEIVFRDASRTVLGSVAFCSATTAAVPVPTGATTAYVYAEGPLLAAPHCGAAASATAGTVTLTQTSN